MEELKILHIASFNGNIGDNANHNGLRRNLHKYLDYDLKFTEIEMREFYHSWGMRSFNTQEFIDICNVHDLVIIGGGNFFELKWDYSSTGTTIDMNLHTIEKIRTPILFFGLGCDIAKGASENTIKKFEKFLDYVTNSNKYMVTLRNDGSFETIRQLYGDKYFNSIHRVADGAFSFKPKSLLYDEISHDSKLIGINIASDMIDIRFNNNLKYTDFINEMSIVINHFLDDRKEYNVILFPHIYSDLKAIYDLLEKIEDPIRRKKIIVAPLLTGMGSEEYIFGMYNKCDMIMGMRFHSNVCAITQNIPTIGLSSYKKIHDLYLELELLDRVIYVNKKGFHETLSNKINYTLDNIDNIKEKYKRVIKKIEEGNIHFYHLLKKWVYSVKNTSPMILK